MTKFLIFVCDIFHFYISTNNFLCIIVKKNTITVRKNGFCLLKFKGPTFNFVRKNAQEAGFCEREGRGDMTKYYFFSYIFS